MLGLSLAKLLVLALIVAGIIYGFRVFARLDRRRQDRQIRKNSGRGAPVKMEQCPGCGTYIVPGSARSCGRPACPY